MVDFRLRLRELSKPNFEAFVFSYLSRQFPGARIRAVDGKGGDEGVDAFAGRLTDGPAIWQCKHFTDRIRRPQQTQILKSLAAALKLNPSVWTLCVPVDLRTAEYRWFSDTIVEPSGGPTRIRLLSASEFVEALHSDRELRDAYFPDNSISTALEVRRLVSSANTLTRFDLSRASTETVQQYLASLDDLDPRLRTVATIGGTSGMRAKSNSLGQVFSFANGEQRIDVFARNLVDYHSDPIKLHTELAADYASGLMEAQKAGIAYELPAGALLKLNSSSELINHFLANQDPKDLVVKVIPQLPQEIERLVMSLTLVAGEPPSAREIPNVSFKIIRSGLDEIEVSCGNSMPFCVRLLMSRLGDRNISISIKPNLEGSSPIKALELLDFLEELDRSHSFSIRDGETGLALLETDETQMAMEGIFQPSAFRKIVEMAARVARYFNTPIRLPAGVSESELKTLTLLDQLVTGAEFHDVELVGTLAKLQNEDVSLPIHSEGLFSVRVDYSEREFNIFGEKVKTGPFRFTADAASVEDLDAFHAAYVGAPAGTAMVVRFKCAGPCRLEFL
jgi:hypothetical protein